MIYRLFVLFSRDYDKISDWFELWTPALVQKSLESYLMICTMFIDFITLIIHDFYITYFWLRQALF